jgi:hypothetical protein
VQSNSFAIGNNAEFDPATRVTVNISEGGTTVEFEQDELENIELADGLPPSFVTCR